MSEILNPSTDVFRSSYVRQTVTHRTVCYKIIAKVHKNNEKCLTGLLDAVYCL